MQAKSIILTVSEKVHVSFTCPFRVRNQCQSAVKRLSGRVPVVTFVNNHFAGHWPATVEALKTAISAWESRATVTEDQIDRLWEAYNCAVYSLVTGRGGLRERLTEAFAWLQKHKAMCDQWPADESEGKFVEELPRLLEVGERLDALTDGELEDLAWDLLRVEHDVAEARSNSRPDRAS